jgi:hypothetical protein
MTRTAVGLCAAAAIGLVASVGAQSGTSQTPATTTSKDAREITVTGCLQRGADGNFTLTNAKMDNMERSGSSTASTTGPTGSTATSSTAGGSAMTAGSTWTLEGGTDLDKHVGHQIQVTGHSIRADRKDDDDAAATSTTTGTTGTSGTTATGTTGTTGTTGEATATPSAQKTDRGTHTRKLDVTSVKMISSSCS